eukprot:3506817-Pleurochrysis_carterae.AAC.3
MMASTASFSGKQQATKSLGSTAPDAFALSSSMHRTHGLSAGPPPPGVTEAAGSWKDYLDNVITTDPIYVDGDLRAQEKELSDFPAGSLRGALADARLAIATEVPWTMPPAEGPLSKEELACQILDQRTSVKGAFAKRRDLNRPMAPQSIHPAKQVAGMDESKIQRMEADMAKKFNEKAHIRQQQRMRAWRCCCVACSPRDCVDAGVATVRVRCRQVSAPMSSVRPSREAEREAAQMAEYLRANELYEKGDYLAAVAEYEVAAAVPALRPYVQLNRGNTFKMLNYQKEAITCYQQCLDDVPPDTPLQKQLHACALNNLATVYEDVSQKQQVRRLAVLPSLLLRSTKFLTNFALQHYSGALALNSKCHVAAKNRANMHLSHAKKLQSTGINGAAAAQHEIAYNMYNRSLDVDWQARERTCFFLGCDRSLDPFFSHCENECAVHFARLVRDSPCCVVAAANGVLRERRARPSGDARSAGQGGISLLHQFDTPEKQASVKFGSCLSIGSEESTVDRSEGG